MPNLAAVGLDDMDGVAVGGAPVGVKLLVDIDGTAGDDGAKVADVLGEAGAVCPGAVGALAVVGGEVPLDGVLQGRGGVKSRSLMAAVMVA
ncbi:hypothetical protein [Streptomyces sp. SP17BM10]|uniref:hypothetical protein n=1 Tax=Streptomyces sp. SP17BM10 TaxID=3002530 RepID=UPI002E76C135|nr:hypothetical protein [Streptomyces sp. SP17BM10]